MAEPPSLSGALHDRVAKPLPPTALTFRAAVASPATAEAAVGWPVTARLEVPMPASVKGTTVIW